jgi:hypothetical protein|nr:MAG TPA: minor tail protein [Caudoviricetes sp.]
MADGKVIIETGLDMTGATKDLNNLGKTISNKSQKATQKLNKETISLEKNLKKAGDSGAKSMQQISSGANKSSKSIGGLKASLGKIVGILAAGFSIRGIVNIGKEAVNLASDLTEVQNVVDTAFGSMSQKMEDFANTAIDTYGISKLTAKNIGSTYTAMARGMGQSLDEATDKALEITGRVADIASFYNLSIDRANTIGRAVYSGETEPLKQIGVIMTEDQLAAFALANGYDTLYKNMNAAQKLEVRQAYFLAQTNLAAGDFVKTQDSWSNQTKILSERWKEFLSVLGSGLIQILTPALKFLNQFVSAITSALTAFNKFLGINTEVSSTGAAGIADIADGMDDVTSSTEAANDAQKDLLGSYDKLDVISKDTSSGATGAGGGAGAGTGLNGLDITESLNNSKTKAFEQQMNKLQSILDKFSKYLKSNFGDTIKKITKDFKKNFINTKNIFSKVLNDIKSLFPDFIKYLQTDFVNMVNARLNFVGDVVNGLWDSWNRVFSDLWDIVIFPFLGKLTTEGLPTISKFLTEFYKLGSDTFTQFKDIFDTVWTEGAVPALYLFSDVFNDVIDLVSQKWNEYGQPIFDGLRTTVEKVGSIIKNTWEKTIKPIWDELMSTLDEIWNKHAQPLLDKFSDFVGKLILLGQRILNNFILPVAREFQELFGTPIGHTIQDLIKLLGLFVDGLMDKANRIFSILNNIIDFVNNVFSGNWEGAWNNIKDVFTNIFGMITDSGRDIMNTLIWIINSVLTGIQDGINLGIRALNSLSFTVPDWIPVIGGNQFGFNIPETYIPDIPYLASGAVIPPNKEFMAVLGDQSSGTNIETPLKTMIEAFNAALDARGGSSHEPIILQLPNGKVIAEIVWNEEEKRYKQTGSYKPRYS